MEIEYKWELPQNEDPSDSSALEELVTPHVRGMRDVEMDAVYYDADDGYCSAARLGLRLRREDGVSVVCLKSPVREGDVSVREEYEVVADDIRTGVELLSEAGAPADVCRKLSASTLVPLCETRFTRRVRSLQVAGEDGSFSAELSLDVGAFFHEGRERPLREVELEYGGGSLDAFHAFAGRLEGALGLLRQPLSKLAQALAV